MFDTGVGKVSKPLDKALWTTRVSSKKQKERDKMSNPFKKQPGETMPNLLGWILIALVDLAVVGLVLMVYATVTGCSHTSSVTRRSSSGDVTTRSASYAGGLVTEYNEEFDSDGDYERCLEVRTGLMPVYRSGRVLNWAEMTDIQQVCFQQTNGFGMAGWNMSGFPGMGMGFGYAWSTPPLSITPGLR